MQGQPATSTSSSYCSSVATCMLQSPTARGSQCPSPPASSALGPFPHRQTNTTFSMHTATEFGSSTKRNRFGSSRTPDLDRMQISHLLSQDSDYESPDAFSETFSSQINDGDDGRGVVSHDFAYRAQRHSSSLSDTATKHLGHISVCSSRQVGVYTNYRRRHSACSNCRLARKHCTIAKRHQTCCARCCETSQTCDLTSKRRDATWTEDRLVPVFGSSGNVERYAIRCLPVCRCPISIGPRTTSNSFAD